MERPLVSVLLPFRNAGRTLDAAIASIAAQTFLDLELLLVDNGSSDEGIGVAGQWAARDQRIILLQEPTVGIAQALNTGLSHARGRFIARMDADDRADPTRLSKQVAFLDAQPEIGVVGTRTRFTTDVEHSNGMRAFVERQNDILSPHDHYVKRFVDAPLAHPTVMFRRELVDRFGAYDTGPVPEDHELWLRWMHHGVQFAKLPEELLTWTDHADRLSRTHVNYSTEAFFATKAKWIAAWYARKYAGSRPVIIAGTSVLCQERARLLVANGMRIAGFTDVRPRSIPGHPFIPHSALPPPGEALIISFISQRGTGDRIAAFLQSRGLVEGEDFILAA
jgi:glycosyltransferase involved in cell wall biosynthesis